MLPASVHSSFCIILHQKNGFFHRGKKNFFKNFRPPKKNARFLAKTGAIFFQGLQIAIDGNKRRDFDGSEKRYI